MSYDEALKRIRVAKERSATALDLSNLGLFNVPHELWDLTNLKTLNLGGNQLNELPGLEKLTNLTRLGLSNNQLTGLPEVECLNRLLILNLGGNELSVLPGLKKLTKLMELRLSNNQLSKFPDLEYLKELTVLNLGGNELTELPGLEKLANLRELRLSNNALRTLPGLHKLIGLKQLNLSRNYLSKLPGIENLVNLEELDLSNNTLSKFPELAKLSALTLLDLSDNQLAELPSLDKLINLTVLRLSNNSLRRLPRLDGLCNLTELRLSNNALSELLGLNKLTSLKELSLSNNALSDLPGIEQLHRLVMLDLQGNQMSELVGLEKLTNLTELSFSKNQLRTLPGFDKLLKLEHLYLWNNELVELPGLDKLTNLRELYLSNNALKELPAFDTLAKLTDLDLSNNQLSELSGLETLTKLTMLNLRGNPLPIDPSILAAIQNPKEIIRSYTDFIKSNKFPRNEAKIILIGEGAVGKTSLRKCIVDGKCVDGETQTEGLEVIDWNLEIRADDDCEAVLLHIWDFGGQEIYHATHKFFFRTRSLFILVVDISDRLRWTTNRLRYWLRNIDQLSSHQLDGRKVPVLLIGNKAEKHLIKKQSSSKESHRNLLTEVGKEDIDILNSKYENLEIKNFFLTACQEHNIINIGSVRNAIVDELENIDAYRLITKKFKDAKDRVKTDPRNFIRRSDFAKLCPVDTEQMLFELSQTGTIVTFDKESNPDLQDLIVLKPRWITESIYKILSANHVLAPLSGAAERKTLRQILFSDGKISMKEQDAELDQIIKLMVNFYLCHIEIDGSRTKYLLPSFFSSRSFETALVGTDTIVFRYEYTILNNNLFVKFLILMMRDAQLRSDKRRHMVSIQDASDLDCQAIVEEIIHEDHSIVGIDGTKSDVPADSIVITVKASTRAKRLTFLQRLMAIIDNLNNDGLSKVKSRFISIPKHQTVFEDYDELLSDANNRISTKRVSALGAEFAIDYLLHKNDKNLDGNHADNRTQSRSSNIVQFPSVIELAKNDYILRLKDEIAELEKEKASIFGKADGIADTILTQIAIVLFFSISGICWWFYVTPGALERLYNSNQPNSWLIGIVIAVIGIAATIIANLFGTDKIDPIKVLKWFCHWLAGKSFKEEKRLAEAKDELRKALSLFPYTPAESHMSTVDSSGISTSES